MSKFLNVLASTTIFFTVSSFLVSFEKLNLINLNIPRFLHATYFDWSLPSLRLNVSSFFVNDLSSCFFLKTFLLSAQTSSKHPFSEVPEDSLSTKRHDFQNFPVSPAEVGNDVSHTAKIVGGD